MNVRLIDRILTNVERIASALFGAAVGYAAYRGLGGMVFLPELAICAAAAAIVGHLLCSRILGAIATSAPQFQVPSFSPEEIGVMAWDELVLTDADQFEPVAELVLTDADRLEADPSEDRMLLLDDALAELGPDSRVVRLFDRKAMPTPGQLKSRIDDHLSQAPSPAAQSDASQALSDALAQLRRSLR